MYYHNCKNLIFVRIFVKKKGFEYDALIILFFECVAFSLITTLLANYGDCHRIC